jgi:hypothetical protein
VPRRGAGARHAGYDRGYWAPSCHTATASAGSATPSPSPPPWMVLAYLKSSASGAWAVAMGSVAGLPEARLWRRRWRKGRDKRGGVKRATSASRAGLRRGASWDPFHNRPTPGASRHTHTINTHERGLGHVTCISCARGGVVSRRPTVLVGQHEAFALDHVGVMHHTRAQRPEGGHTLHT